MTHRDYADPLWAPYRNAVAARLCLVGQSLGPEEQDPATAHRGAWCWSCWRSQLTCRCQAADA